MYNNVNSGEYNVLEKLNDQAVENVENLKYLGTYIMCFGESVDNIYRRANQRLFFYAEIEF